MNVKVYWINTLLDTLLDSRDLRRPLTEWDHHRTTTDHILFSVCGGDTSGIPHSDLLDTPNLWSKVLYFF